MKDVSLLHHVFSSFCPDSSAVVNGEGEVLFIRSSRPVDYGTLGVAAQTVMKYLPLKAGEVALLNDPYSGGGTLNEFTFVTKLAEAGPQSLWWVWRQKHDSSFVFAKSVEEEGLRVPPTPIYQNKQLNQMILGAMAAHPLCPGDFAPWTEKICGDIIRRVESFQNLLQKQKIPLGKNLQKDYLTESRRVVRDKISEGAGGETRVDVVLDNKEFIRLHMEIHEGQVRMDFTGTSASKSHLLTESATYGVCLSALARFYHFDSLVNAGAFSALQITKPSGCLLNAKYPSPLSAGAFAVQAALQTAISLALMQIHNQRQKALCAFCPVEIQLREENKSALTLRLPGGAGGGALEGAAAFACSEVLSESFSIEKLERDWPVRVERLDFRNSLQGKGEFNGGRGLSLRFSATKNLHISWRTDLTQHRAKIPRQSSFGDHGEVTFISSQGEEKKLPSSGQLELQAGDSLMFCSGVGGGWGQVSTDKD